METRTVGGRKFLILSWADIEKLVENIEEELGRDGYRPDTLVGILRGGMIVADLLSDLLNIREVYVVGCKSYAGLSAGEVRLYHDLLLKDLGGRMSCSSTTWPTQAQHLRQRSIRYSNHATHTQSAQQPSS
jgi:hypothetical protein